MGWKAVKTHYRIEHIVDTVPNCIRIGSGYIRDIIVIDLDGIIVKRYSGGDPDLTRYMREMEENPQLLAQLVREKDVFACSIQVYTYDDDAVVEKECEVLGYPNVTHDGELMYENTYSPDRDKMAKRAKENARAGVQLAMRHLRNLREDTVRCEAEIAKWCAAVNKLDADHPDTGEASSANTAIADAISVAPGCKYVPIIANDEMIYAGCEASTILGRSQAKAVIEAAIMAAPDLPTGASAVVRNDERAIAYKRAANTVLALASSSAASGNPVSFADLAEAILALPNTDGPQTP
jgi:predicted transcriptional regulator